MQGTHSSWQPNANEHNEHLQKRRSRNVKQGVTRNTEATAAHTSKLDLWPPSIKQYPFQHILTLSKDYTLSFISSFFMIQCLI